MQRARARHVTPAPPPPHRPALRCQPCLERRGVHDLGAVPQRHAKRILGYHGLASRSVCCDLRPARTGPHIWLLPRSSVLLCSAARLPSGQCAARLPTRKNSVGRPPEATAAALAAAAAAAASAQPPGLAQRPRLAQGDDGARTHQYVVPRLQRIHGRLLKWVELERVLPGRRALVRRRRQRRPFLACRRANCVVAHASQAASSVPSSRSRLRASHKPAGRPALWAGVQVAPAAPVAAAAAAALAPGRVGPHLGSAVSLNNEA